MSEPVLDETFAEFFNDVFPVFISHPWTILHIAVFLVIFGLGIYAYRKEHAKK